MYVRIDDDHHVISHIINLFYINIYDLLRRKVIKMNELLTMMHGMASRI